MKQSRSTTLSSASIALAAILAAALASSGTAAFAQTAAPRDNNRDHHSPMVKPPEATSGPGDSSNPDNMPIRRPRTPTNDRMTHEPPASSANAK